MPNKKMRVLYATGNSRKIEELRVFIENNNFVENYFDIDDMSAIDINNPYIEGERSFAENALHKAESMIQCIDSTNYDAIVCDDMGICIPAMRMQPGVKSKRFAGEDSSYRLKIGLIINYLRHNKPDYEVKDESYDSSSKTYIGYKVYDITSLACINLRNNDKFTVTTSELCLIKLNDVIGRYDLRTIDESRFYDNIVTHIDIPELKHFSDLSIKDKYPYNCKNKAFMKLFSTLIYRNAKFFV